MLSHLWGFDVQELHALVVEDDPDISSALVETLHEELGWTAVAPRFEERVRVD